MGKRKNIVILGSTGSIGESALDVVRQYHSQLRVVGLGVYSNIAKLSRQVSEFKPRAVAIADQECLRRSNGRLGTRAKVLTSIEGMCRLASLPEADLVLVAITGGSAILPLLSAIRARKQIALANKEALVMAGELICRQARANGVEIIPIDSEQNAIFQCLQGHGRGTVETLYLTASGGPLVDYSRRQLQRVSIRQALAHPRWRMGRKISVDSATLMNKGLEVIEARWLFGIPIEKIKVLVHRQAMIHSMAEFVDGSILAQMAVTDMRLPIQYALTYPERWRNDRFRLNPLRMEELTFDRPDASRFPCLGLAYEAARIGGTAPCALNAANEVAVDAFLRGRLAFNQIPKVIKTVLKEDGCTKGSLTLRKVLDADRRARARSQALVAVAAKRRR